MANGMTSPAVTTKLAARLPRDLAGGQARLPHDETGGQAELARDKRLGRYGMEMILDLHDCDPQVIRSKQRLKAYVDQLCALLKMKAYGKTLLPYFGLSDPRTAGYSLLQFIETSSITGHFSELWNSAYLNIFSCQPFDPDEALEFTKRFFKPKKVRRRLLLRG